MIPALLYHYYREKRRPFRTLDELEQEEGETIVVQLGTTCVSMAKQEYVTKRRIIEAKMRKQFLQKGGLPRRHSPYYAMLGTWSLREQDDRYRAVTLPLSSFDPEIISFTYPDSLVSYHEEFQSGLPIPCLPHHGQVYRIEQLPELVDQVGLPKEAWHEESNRKYEVFIEAQIWDDRFLGAYVDSGE